MMFSAGMGIGLMFYGVAEPLSHFATPAAGHRRAGQTPQAVQTRDGHHAVPLDAAPVGDLRRRRPRHRLRHLPQGPLAADQRGVRAAARASAPRDRSARSSTSWRSSRRCSARPPRSASARCRSAAGCKIVGWHRRRRQRGARRHHRRAHRRVRRSRRSPASPRASSGCPTSTWCWRSPWRCSCSSSARRSSSSTWCPPRSATTSATSAEMAARTDASGGDAMATWLAGWTVFYWAWWISWTPFVGMFIARIRRGRTIRQFVTGVLLVPSVVSLVWFAIFGGAAINAAATRHRPRRRRRSAEAPAVQRCSTSIPLATRAERPGDGPRRRSSSSPAPTRRRSSWARCPSAARSSRPARRSIFWGVADRRRRGGDAGRRRQAGRRLGVDRAAEHHDHGGAAVRRGHGRAVRRAGQGPAQRPADAARRATARRADRAGGHRRCGRARSRRLRHRAGAHRRQRRRGRPTRTSDQVTAGSSPADASSAHAPGRPRA